VRRNSHATRREAVAKGIVHRPKGLQRHLAGLLGYVWLTDSSEEFHETAIRLEHLRLATIWYTQRRCPARRAVVPATIFALWQFRQDPVTGEVVNQLAAGAGSVMDLSVPAALANHVPMAFRMDRVPVGAASLALRLDRACMQAKHMVRHIPTALRLPEFWAAFQRRSPVLVERSAACLNDLRLDRPEYQDCADESIPQAVLEEHFRQQAAPIRPGWQAWPLPWFLRKSTVPRRHPVFGTEAPTQAAVEGTVLAGWLMYDGCWRPFHQRPDAVYAEVNLLLGRTSAAAWQALVEIRKLPRGVDYESWAAQTSDQAWAALRAGVIQEVLDDPAQREQFGRLLDAQLLHFDTARCADEKFVRSVLADVRQPILTSTKQCPYSVIAIGEASAETLTIKGQGCRFNFHELPAAMLERLQLEAGSSARAPQEFTGATL